MGKSLVIVESPAKAKTINKYLGKDYVVKSSVGHVRDLPTGSRSSGTTTRKRTSTAGLSAEEKVRIKQEKDRQALVTRMGIDPDHGWKAQYQVLPGKEKVVNELKALAEKADQIYLATDLDREGEAIAWHLQELIGGDPSRYQRVVFNEITKSAIQNAFANPDHLNIDRVNAQQARRFLDRVVGFMVSPLLWKKVARGLSAGRVQSVAVRLVVERERDIKAFVPEEFWRIHAELNASGETFKAELQRYAGKAFKAVNEEQALAAVNAMQTAGFKVSAREVKPSRSRPSAPFITSTLQQAASTRLGFGVKKTMMLAQRLYEAGHITYMRTDSTNLSQDAVTACRGYIGSNFGSRYLPDAPNVYGSKGNAQEAHEAIRPSDVNLKASQLAGVEKDAERLYDLIWKQFVACQMVPAEYDATKLTVLSGEYELRATGRTLKFDGWTRVLAPLVKKAEDEVILPMVTQDQALGLETLNPAQHFTKPPARFSEAALVKELEKRGIGRPSTYASIISTIQDRGYVRLEARRFYAEKMGEIVTDRLLGNFKELMSYDFTAQMEDTLDSVASGSRDWLDVLDVFYADFSEKLGTANLPATEGGMSENQMVLVDIKCDKCERQMGIRTGQTGVFLGCSGYALPPKERCNNTMNLTPGDEAESALESETESLMAMRRCPKCGTAMDSYLIDESRKLHVCGNNPNCDGVVVEKGEFKIKGYDGPLIECDRCSSDMQLKSGRFGKYFGCTNDECKNTRKLLKSGEVAPPKEDPVQLPELPCEKSDAHFVLRDGAAGIFLAASTFPKSRETRAPLVSELARFRDRISAKFYYLADGPAQDPDGNASLVRFSRKNKEQYITSEVNGKATGWTAHYREGKWVEEAKAKKTTTRKKKK